MKLIPAIIFLGLMPALRAERSVEEWSIELTRKFAAMASFRAIYTASKPEEGVGHQGVLVIEKESGAALVQLYTGELGGAIWWEPDGKGSGTTYGLMGQQPIKIHGLAELLKQLDGFKILFGSGQASKPQEVSWGMIPALTLGKSEIGIGLASASKTSLPWFGKDLQEVVEEIRENNGRVKFTLADGSWVILEKATGLLAERGFSVEGGERKLVLDAVDPLHGMKQFRKEIPAFNPNVLRNIGVGELDMANLIHRALFYAFLQFEKKMNPGDLEAFFAKNQERFFGYWSATWGKELPPGVPPAFAKALLDEEPIRVKWREFKEDRPFPAKDLTFETFLQGVRRGMAQEVLRQLKQKEAKLPTLARLTAVLKAEIAKLPEEDRKRGETLAAMLANSQLEAMVNRLLSLRE